jgi:hypothetical protein
MTTNRCGAGLRTSAVLSTVSALSTLALAVVVPASDPLEPQKPPAATVRMTTGPTDPRVPQPPDWRGSRLHRYSFPGGGRITAI